MHSLIFSSFNCRDYRVIYLLVIIRSVILCDYLLKCPNLIMCR